MNEFHRCFHVQQDLYLVNVLYSGGTRVLRLGSVELPHLPDDNWAVRPWQRREYALPIAELILSAFLTLYCGAEENHTIASYHLDAFVDEVLSHRDERELNLSHAYVSDWFLRRAMKWFRVPAAAPPPLPIGTPSNN